ncbi:Hypothetical predicted protein, partial [Paramuricea clavata]
MRNNPSSAILFTLNGPVCCRKVSLECRDCSIKYGVCKYSDEHGARYYQSHLTLDIIEVSNVAYIHKDLYKWMPSLSNHCWVSFSGFAEAYNEIYQEEIKLYSSLVD